MIRSQIDPNAYFRHDLRGTVILLLHVDDVKTTGTSMHLISEFIHQLHHEFAMTDLGPIWRFLGVEYMRTEEGLLLHQTNYAHEIFAHF